MNSLPERLLIQFPQSAIKSVTLGVFNELRKDPINSGFTFLILSNCILLAFY
ncbi:hypothetical protein lpa_02843 [Legionella pneumophila 2300/99 Alcoy]|nr:hypothetical protein lpa_02843 [Legionella pneumophila 2300/99 Alcoy]